MAGDANALISGTAMAVIIGSGSILAAIFANIGFGDKLILFFLGLFFFWAGLRFSRG